MILSSTFRRLGTTAHAVMNLNREDNGQRKYILVEMADYFDDVLLPRVKKVAFSSEWKDGVAQEEGEGMSPLRQILRAGAVRGDTAQRCLRE